MILAYYRPVIIQSMLTISLGTLVTLTVAVSSFPVEFFGQTLDTKYNTFKGLLIFPLQVSTM